MRKTIILLLVFLGGAHMAESQTYSSWISDKIHPDLKVRYATGKSREGNPMLFLQATSSKHCKLDITFTLCNKDPRGKNNWHSLELFSGKTITRTFKLTDSCSDGFWWWYKNYYSKNGPIDDN